MKHSRRTLFFLIFICGIAGSSVPTFFKIALEELNPGTITIIRYVTAFMALLGFAYLSREGVRWAKIRSILLVSTLYAYTAVTSVIAVKYIQAASVPILYTLVPIFVAFLSWLILKEHFGHSKLMGSIIGFAGVLLASAGPLIDKTAQLEFSSTGVVLIALGSLSFAFFSVLSKPMQDKLTPAEMMLGVSFVVIVCQAVYMGLINEPLTIAGSSWQALGATLFVGLFGTAFFWGLYQYLVKVGTPVIGSLNNYIQPAAGALWALIIIGDHLSFITLFGGLVALVGVAQVNGFWAELRKKYLKT